MNSFFISCPPKTVDLLVREVTPMGLNITRETASGLQCEGVLRDAYQVCLHSRIANRVIWQLESAEVNSTDELYDLALSIDWSKHFDSDGTFAISVVGKHPKINQTHYATQRVKDAIVDQFRESTGERPDIVKDQPDVRIHVVLSPSRTTFGIDLSGAPLNQRGYRVEATTAPLKENLAAATLMRSQWDKKSPLIDPMCGSGTFLIEGAMMAAHIAPGLHRHYWGFEHWKQHQAELWQAMVDEAKAKVDTSSMPVLIGFDKSGRALEAASDNADEIDLLQFIQFEERQMIHFERPDSLKEAETGWIVTNPPYGERLGNYDELAELHTQLGIKLKEHFMGWHVAIFTGNPGACTRLNIKAKRSHTFFNGALECRLLRFDLEEKAVLRDTKPLRSVADLYYNKPELKSQQDCPDFINRLKKNVKKLSAWAKGSGVYAYRIYDADIPEYSMAIDWFEDIDHNTYVHVQEYQAPRTIDEHKAKHRLYNAVASLPETLGVEPKNIFIKIRKRQKGKEQYEKLRAEKNTFPIQEGNSRLLVNLTDYLDTGLFLDHRSTRLQFAKTCKGQDVLNLFCYTASASIHAARAGAKSTTSVDLSKTYLFWAENNLKVNGLSLEKNQLIHANCIEWLNKAVEEGLQFDRIFLDPPTFSTSKRMEDSFDIQRDHIKLIQQAMKLLRKDGFMMFSTNLRKFKLSDEIENDFHVNNTTQKTIPFDFQRNTRIHHSFEIRQA